MGGGGGGGGGGGVWVAGGPGKSVRGLCISLGGFIMSKLDNYI